MPLNRNGTCLVFVTPSNELLGNGEWGKDSPLAALIRYSPWRMFGRNTASNPIAGRKAQT
jgi:hypothetical protein